MTLCTAAAKQAGEIPALPAGRCGLRLPDMFPGPAGHPRAKYGLRA